VTTKADNPEAATEARRECCLACPRCASVDQMAVQCSVAGRQVPLATGRCRLRRWVADSPPRDPSTAAVTRKQTADSLQPDRLIVGVLSSTGEAYQARRIKCQRTWLPVLEAIGVEVVFLIGTDQTDHPPRLVLPGEHGRIGTELHLPCPDDYASLSQKTRWFCRWALANRAFDYLFKCDDDTYLVPDRLLGMDLSGVDYLGGEWTPSVGYASGGAGYFLSHNAASIVASELTQTQWAEDLLVGSLLHDQGIRFNSDARFVAYANKDHRPKPDNTLVTAHACETPWEEHQNTWQVNAGERFGRPKQQPCHPGVKDCTPADYWNHHRPACCTRMMRETLFRVADLLDEARITWWVDYGTLLGAYRHDGGFIPHDWDCDISVRIEHRGEVEALRDRFLTEGFDYTDDGVVRVFRSTVNRHHTDIFFWERCGDTLELRGYPSNDPGESETPVEWIAPMGEIEVMGRKMPCPNCVPEALAHRYGTDFMTPKVYG